MGYWCTLHLFDDEKFYKEVVPKMKGEKGNLEPTCKDFLTLYTIGGMKNLSDSEITNRVAEVVKSIHEISSSMDDSFKKHMEFSKIEDYEKRNLYLGELNGHYEFCKFLEYYIFKCCADFFPHVPLGKGGLSRNFNLDPKSLSSSILSHLDHWNEFFCAGMMGITNWLDQEEVELLHLDKENLTYEENAKGKSIYNFLEIAYENKLGVVVGIDMRESLLEGLPAHKLVTPESWKKLNTEGMLFKR